MTELPYQASMKAIQERIAELVNSRELDGIRSLDDLSAGDDTKLVIGLKRDANANVVLNNLYKLTPLQTSFGVNMVALVDVNDEGKGVPRTLNLRAGPAGLRRPPGRRHHPPHRVPPGARRRTGPTSSRGCSRPST